jgi:hypothetical protein
METTQKSMWAGAMFDFPKLVRRKFHKAKPDSAILGSACNSHHVNLFPCCVFLWGFGPIILIILRFIFFISLSCVTTHLSKDGRIAVSSPHAMDYQAYYFGHLYPMTMKSMWGRLPKYKSKHNIISSKQ